MEQRLPRLGDIVDDYCPRERRITNHAIVAIVDNAIRQTRCTTCDAEHVFKDGREPRKRKTTGTLFDQVLADVTTVPGRVTPRPPASAPESTVDEPSADAPAAMPAAALAAMPADPASADVPPSTPAPAEEAWSSHRRLIRASLPKTDGEPPPPRPIPEFTMHQRTPARGGRQFRPIPGREADGNVMGNGRDGRFGRSTQGGGNGFGGNGNGHGSAPDGARGGRGRSGRRRGHHKRAR